MSKKYEFTGETKDVCGRTLHRIRAMVSFANVKDGDLGGWIETENNLSHDGNAWVSDDAVVFDNAKVLDNAFVSGSACVSDNAEILDYAKVCGGASVFDDAKVCGSAIVRDNAMLSDSAVVGGSSKIYGQARVSCNAMVFGNSVVSGCAGIHGYAEVYGDASVCDCALVGGKARVCGNASVSGYADVSGHAVVCGDAVVSCNRDFIVFKNCWSSMRWFTYTRSNKMWKVGCFHGTGDELIKKAYADSETSGVCYEAVVRAMETIEAAMKKQEESRWLELKGITNQLVTKE